MKLSFDESATSARKGLGRGVSAKSVAVNTQVDKRVVVVCGNEPLKHKLDCKGGNEEAEKVQVVGDATGGCYGWRLQHSPAEANEYPVF